VYAFDLGNTLLEYAGLPLSWEAHYDQALDVLASHLGRSLSPPARAQAAAILRRYNTRLNPRTEEVPFSNLLGDLAPALGAGERTKDEWVSAELGCARAFFSVFRQRLQPFPDALPLLQTLRQRGRRVGVFTDVPYGMPRDLVMEDIADAGLSSAIDVCLTSRDAGSRKPAAAALGALAAALDCPGGDFVYVGDERKDIEAAHAVGGRAILIDRAGADPRWGQDLTVRTLAELTNQLEA
jgi:putative hydrolase of the HAD superfamily